MLSYYTILHNVILSLKTPTTSSQFKTALEAVHPPLLPPMAEGCKLLEFAMLIFAYGERTYFLYSLLGDTSTRHRLRFYSPSNDGFVVACLFLFLTNACVCSSVASRGFPNL